MRPGPTSSSTLLPSSSSSLIPSAKRTVPHRCRVQYSGSVASSGRIHVPVTLETNGISGSASRMARSRSARRSATGSISAEWKACSATSRRHATPSSTSSASRAATDSAGPDTVHRPGALCAASASPSRSRGPRAAGSMGTASMAPAGSPEISRARSASSASASSSRKTPATVATTYSPSECPIIDSGCTPQLIHSRASAYSTTKTAGCARSVRPSGSPAAARPSMPRRSVDPPASTGAPPAACSGAGSPGKSHSRTSLRVCAPRIRAQRSTSSRKTGSASYSPRAICT